MHFKGEGTAPCYNVLKNDGFHLTLKRIDNSFTPSKPKTSYMFFFTFHFPLFLFTFEIKTLDSGHTFKSYAVILSLSFQSWHEPVGFYTSLASS